jgi:hypothetical protein
MLLLLVIRGQRVEVGCTQGDDILDATASGQGLEHGPMVNAVPRAFKGDNVAPCGHSEENRTSNAESPRVFNHIVEQLDLSNCQ